MASLQWMSTLFYFISGPLKSYTRLQSSAAPTPQGLIALINKYKPCAAAWTPFLFSQFIVAAENVCDLSYFKYFVIGGSALEKPLLDRFRGYKNNPGETKLILTEDGWFKTGDIFYKDDQDFLLYSFFVERKKLIVKHNGFQISVHQLEEVLKQHPSVTEACVVNIPVPECMELPVAAIFKRNGDKLNLQDLFDLISNNITEGRKLQVGFFFLDSFPMTLSEKLHRAKVEEMAKVSSWSVLDVMFRLKQTFLQ